MIYRPVRTATLGLLVLAAAAPATQPSGPAAPIDLVSATTHGMATVDLVRRRMYMADRGLYVQEIRPADADRFLPVGADCWSVGVQLSALTAAARLDPRKYAADVRRYVDAIDKYYWVSATDPGANGIAGYDSGPKPRKPDRYYDDNAWVALDLVEAFEVTANPRDLDRAVATLKYVLSGEDDKLGGGLYWRERRRDTKNTCSQAPGLCAAVRVYQHTHDKAQLAAAIRLYNWTAAHLRDEHDELYFDHLTLAGKLGETKWSYNTALMIRGGCLLADATGDGQYLKDAQRSAASAVAKWVDPATGGIRDPGRFAHLLTESLLELSARDHDPRWAAAARSAVAWVWDHERDPAGFFPEGWDKPQPRPVADVLLINQASAARGLLRAAWPDAVAK